MDFGGIAAGRKRTETVDSRIRGLVAEATAGTAGVALVAVGSYGRRELTPHSDVDVLLLHQLRARDAIETLTRAVIYPLWDAGYELGYAVRSLEDCLAAGRDDVVVATTLFDTRLVCGDAAALADLDTAIAKWRRKRARQILRSLMAPLSDRWARYGDVGRDLEPHLKEGRGGLRDLQALRWIGERPDAGPAADLDLFLAARSALHEWAGKRDDKLQLRSQAAVAQSLGVAGTRDRDARDVLMAAIFDAARPVAATLEWRSTATLRPVKRFGPPPGFTVKDGELSRSRPAAPAGDPPAGLHAALAVDRVPPSRDLVEWAKSGPSSQLPWSEDVTTTFFRFLRDAGTGGWEYLDVTGLWTRYLPELGPARGKAQHNPLHDSCVDAHSWECVLEARPDRLRTAGPVARDVLSELTRPEHDLLLLTALLHDAGKGLPGDHSRAGTVLARRLCERIGLGADAEETVAFCVANHLTLPDFATTRDLDDEELVISLAARIRQPGWLRLLYLLSIADARATGSAAWSTWKSSLLDELYIRLSRVVEDPGLVGREAQNRIERTRAEVRRRAGVDERELDLFPRRYLLTQPPARIVAHIGLLAGLGPTGLGVHAEGERVSIISPDRPGLLRDIAGVLAIHGVDIRTADIFTRADGVAVDVLSVTGRKDTIPDRAWERVSVDLEAAARGAIDLDAAVAERSLRYDRRTSAGSVTVAVDNGVSDWYSLVDVQGPDRVGFLHDITSVLVDHGYDVHFAKVATEGGHVRDSFSVRDAVGGKIRDPDPVTERLSRSIRSRVESRHDAV